MSEGLGLARQDGGFGAAELIPAPVRAGLAAIHAFLAEAEKRARRPGAEGRAALDAWSDELDRCRFGEAEHPVFVALLEAIERLDLPLPPLAELLEAVRIERGAPRFATFESLRNYTARSAEPLGRLLLAAAGALRPELARFADELATALQLTSFWRNVAPDAARGRVYLPGEDLHFFGVGESELAGLEASPPLRQLLRFQVARTRSLFARARPLLRGFGLGASLVWHQGMAALDELEAADFDVLGRLRGTGSGGAASFLAGWLAASGPARPRSHLHAL
jgi:phytoene/squalene synthetase